MSEPTLGAQVADTLRASMLGDVIQPTDPTYDDARKIWNGNVDRHPGVIARCAGVADVMTAVRVARDAGIETTVRGGGHAVAGYALNDDGLVIDLSGMTGTRVDPLTRTIRVEGGCLNEHLDRSEGRAFHFDVELLDRGDEHMAAVRLAPQDGREQSHHRRAPDRLAVVVPGAVARDAHPGIAAAIGVPLIDRRQLSLVDQPLELG